MKELKVNSKMEHNIECIDIDDNYLKDYMKEELNTLLSEGGLKDEYIIKDIDLVYSLSYSQGDGVGMRNAKFSYNIINSVFNEEIKFKELFEYIGETFNICTNQWGNYCHERTFYVEYPYIAYMEDMENIYKTLNKDITEDELNKKADDFNDYVKEYETKICGELQDICGKLEQKGYRIIENMYKDNKNNYLFEEWKKINNIEIDENIWEFNYTTDPVEYIKGEHRYESILEGKDLYVEINLVEHKREIITNIDGKENKKENEIFYTLK